MVMATITWRSGGTETLCCDGWPQLFKQLEEYGRYKELNAREIDEKEATPWEHQR